MTHQEQMLHLVSQALKNYYVRVIMYVKISEHILENI